MQRDHHTTGPAADGLSPALRRTAAFLAIGGGLGCQGVLNESLDEVRLLKVYHAVKRVVTYLEAIRCPSSVLRVPRAPP